MAGTRRTTGILAASLAAFGLVVAAAGALATTVPSGPRIEKTGSLYRVEYGTRSYTFDAAWRTEKAWRKAPRAHHWTEIPVSRAAWMEGMRSSLLDSLSLPSVRLIPEEGETELKLLRSLGYI